MSCILVIDDDELVRELVSDALLDAGYAVAKATDGVEALDKLAEYPPDAILLDLMMPGMDGWAVLEAMRRDARWRRIPVCLMSAAPVVRRTAQQRGVVVTVEKPFGIPALLAEVKHLLASGNQAVDSGNQVLASGKSIVATGNDSLASGNHFLASDNDLRAADDDFRV